MSSESESSGATNFKTLAVSLVPSSKSGKPLLEMEGTRTGDRNPVPAM